LLQPIRAPPPIPKPSPAPVKPVIEEPEEPEVDPTLAELLKRQLLFKQAALNAKKSGDAESAVKYLRVSKVQKFIYQQSISFTILIFFLAI
jgi:hypothetical protein